MKVYIAVDTERQACVTREPSKDAASPYGTFQAQFNRRQATEEAGPIFDDEGIYIQLPKQNSAAMKSGLHKGDVILAAGGGEIESYGDLQGVVRSAEPGGEIRLTVRRSSDEVEEVALLRP